MSIDKLAPQAVEAEQSVLGSILIDADAILKVGDFLQAGRLLSRPARATSTRRCSRSTASASRSTS